MSFNTKDIFLLILGVTAIVSSRVLFVFFNDPEGPNLLIVLVLAALLYLLSLAAYFFIPLVPWKRFLLAVVVQIVLVFGLWVVGHKPAMQPSHMTGASDAKDATYSIEGQSVTLKDGVAETPAAPGSASTIVTRYFGNELVKDLDGDGRDDVAFILTQSRGGSGTFYYAVAALNTDHGYIGSDGYLLGDRIAPQSTTPSPNPAQKYVVVFNYADRAPGEPMTAQPSVGKSVYLKLNPATIQWGIVVPNFEGESR